MNKTLARVLAAILVLCMLPATFLTALAGGLGVAKNETENQSIDNANGQYIPETIVIDGKFDDTGWAIEGWNYVTASTGNWNVESPDKDAQTMMYQYQLRADYKYFYAGAVVVLPANMNSAQFKVYLSDDASTYKTASLFTVSLDKTATEQATLVVNDCDSSDSVSVALNGDQFKCEYLGDGKFYIEFRNAAANSYNTASDVQIKYYVSLDVQVDGKWQSLYHPVYATANSGHVVPTSEYWPGGGNLLEVSYTDLEIRHNGSQKTNGTSINPGTDGYKGAVTLDGLFNEDIWKGLTDYYTLDSDKNNLVDFVNADKGIVGGLSGNMYTGTSSHLADTSTVHWLPNNLVAGNKYESVIKSVYKVTNSGTHISYDDEGYKELTDGIIVNDYAYWEKLYVDDGEARYHNNAFVVWNVASKSNSVVTGMNVTIPLGNGVDTYPLQVVNIYTATVKCNNDRSETASSGNGILNQEYKVEYTTDGTTWNTFGTVAKNDYEETYTKKNVVSVATPVYAKKIRVSSTGVSSLAFVSEIEAFASTAAANKSTTYTTENKANDPSFVGKYDFRTDDEYFYGALITTSKATTLKVGSTTVSTEWEENAIGYNYEFKVKKAGLDFGSGVSVTVDSVLYNGMIVNHYNNNAADDVNYDGKLTDSIWAPVTAGDKEFYYASNSGKVFSDFETLIYDVKSDYEYIYGAAIVQGIGTWTQEETKLRLYINPRDKVGNTGDLNFYIVEMYYTDQNVTDKSFARILKYDGTTVQTNDITYRWSELCYIRRDEANKTLTFEFKIPYKLFSWKGVNEQKTTKTQKHNDFFTDISKSDSDIAFTYMMSLYNMDTVYERFFSKALIHEKRSMTMNNTGSEYVNYKDNCVDVTYGDFIDTVAIDGHIDEGVWQDKDFYQANFANSTLLTQPTKGEVYDYSYMLYGGSNYIYGAVELNDIAREGTTFTLWINNFVDEYKWIGDNDSKTPFITYDIYQHTTQQTQYNQNNFILNNEGEVAALSLGTTLPYTANRLQYYTNYKYEFDLSAAKSTATPDYYFATDSNLEKDKTWIKKDVNYKYAITTINGKTYLEFMIDVDNFHWDYNSFEYVTSMTHTVSSGEKLTVYHPEINDRANFWLTNANVDNGYRHDGSGNLFSSATDYAANTPPTIYWQSLKLEPVGNNQYKIIEMTNTSTKWVLQDGSVKQISYTKTAYPKVVDWHNYTEEEASKGIIYYTHFTGSLYEDGQLILDIDNQQLRYPWARPADFRKVEKTIDGKTHVAYINRSSFDGRSARAEISKNIFLGWSVGDVIEMGYQGTTQIENKEGTDKSKNVLSVSALLDHEELLSADELEINSDFYGRPWNEFADEKDMPESGYFGNKINITSYSYVESAEIHASNWNDPNNTKLNDGEKLTQDLAMTNGKSVVLYMYNGDGSKSKSEGIIANIAANTQTNVYTAYLNASSSGLHADGANMEIWGSNDGTSWQRVTGVSYRQLLLRKGDGMDDGTSGNSAGASNPTLSISGSNSVYEGRTDWKNILQDKKTDENAKTDDKDSTNHSKVDSPAVLFKNKNEKSDDKYGEDTIEFVLDYGPNKVITNKLIVGTYNVPAWSIGRPANRVTIQYWDGSAWKHAETISLQGDTAMFDKHTFTLSKAYEATKFKVIFNYTYNSSKSSYNEYIGLTELRLSYTDVDSYTLTAIAAEPVKYSKIKFVLSEASSANNYLALDEIEVSYSADIAKLPTKNILHLNTDQGTTAVDANGEYTTFKGRYNTEGTTWKNTGDSMVNPVSTSNTSYPNNVFAETVVTPGYGYNITSDEGFYTNFYIERVSSDVDQSHQPDIEGKNKWDTSTNGILKKLEHIAPDVIDVDGDLGDTGWDGVWTDVDGLKNATNFNGTGTDFKYQLRADGEYLYVAAIIDAAYASANPEFKLWIKSDDAATTFTHLYSAGKGETVLAIGAQATDSNGVVDDPYLVYGKENVDGSITLNGAFGAVQNDSSTPNGLLTIINKNNYLDSAIFGYTKEVVESTHDGVWSWTENPITQGHRVALEHGYIGSAAGKSVGNAIGTASQTIVEFRVALSEFVGADGFEYFVEATTTSGSTIYPHIYTEKGYDEYHHPSWSWDSSSAKKVTAEDMTGWGIYRMVNDYAPMTSLGAKINPSYGANNQKAIRFGARYTEEFIRRQATVEGTDYWDVETAGIVFVPTHVIPTYNPYDLTIETSSAKVVEALDIVNWKNDTPDGSTNFADYTSFVFYVNLVGIPDNAVNMEFSFRGFVDYYGKVTGSDTYYGIPLERSYSLVGRTENEGIIDDVRNAELYDYSVKIENGNGVDYYTGYSAENIAQAESLLCDGNVPYYLGSLSSSRHDADKTPYAYLFKNTAPANNVGCTFSTILTYEQEVAFDTVDLGLYMIPRWKVAPPKSVTVYVKENGVWVEKETIDDIYPYTAEVIQGIGISDEDGNELSRALSVSLSEKYVAQEIKLEFTFPEFVYVQGMTNVDSSTNWHEFEFVGLTEVGLSIR